MSQEQQSGKAPYRMTEEDLILEVNEDSRLRRIGIDPDDDPLAIYLELKRRIAARQPDDAPE